MIVSIELTKYESDNEIWSKSSSISAPSGKVRSVREEERSRQTKWHRDRRVVQIYLMIVQRTVSIADEDLLRMEKRNSRPITVDTLGNTLTDHRWNAFFHWSQQIRWRSDVFLIRKTVSSLSSCFFSATHHRRRRKERNPQTHTHTEQDKKEKANVELAFPRSLISFFSFVVVFCFLPGHRQSHATISYTRWNDSISLDKDRSKERNRQSTEKCRSSVKQVREQHTERTIFVDIIHSPMEKEKGRCRPTDRPKTDDNQRPSLLDKLKSSCWQSLHFWPRSYDVEIPVNDLCESEQRIQHRSRHSRTTGERTAEAERERDRGREKSSRRNKSDPWQ